ncbi:MAG: TonB-dependent receptor [Ignavibacteriaceae bacterium]
MNFKFTLFLIAVFYSFVFAQNNAYDPDTVYILEPVVVSARAGNSIINIPYAIDLIDSARIQNEIKGLSLNEVVNQVPGLIVSSRNNPSTGDKISIRGIGSRASFGVRGIKIIYDGIPLTFADGQSELNNLDLSSIGNIEVLHGPASSLYGNAAGGVINIESQKPSLKTISLNPVFTAGSFGFRKYNLKASGTINRFAYLLSLNKLLYNGFREHSSASTISINSILSYNISAKIKLKGIINYFDSPYLLNPSSLIKADALNAPEYVRPYIINQGAGEKVSEGNYGISLTSEFNRNFTNTTTVYFIKRSLLNPIPGTIIDLRRNAGGFRTFFEKKFPEIYSGTSLSLKGGFDFEFQDDLRKEYANNGLTDINIKPEDIFSNLQYGNSLLNQKEIVNSTAPFISAELNWNKKLDLQTGLRFDNYSFKVDDYLLSDGNNSGRRRMSSFSPMAGIIFLPVPYIKIYANYATSFQTPTTNELSNNPSGTGGFNPSLEPEKIKSYELGTWGILQQYNLNFEAAFFLMNFNNMLISYQSQQAGSEEIFYKNAGKAENIGAEIKLTWEPIDEMKITASYTKMHFIFKDYLLGFTGNSGAYEYNQLDGNFIPGIPQNYFTGGINYTLPFNLSFSLKAEWFDKYFTNDFNGPIPGSNSPIENYINNNYLKADLILSYNFTAENYELNLFAGIDNIFNKRYNGSIVQNAAGDRFFEPSPGRNFYIKTGIKF